MADYKIGILQINPQTLWRRGGGEIHAEKYIEHGNKNGFKTERFNPETPFDYDLLHFFGAGYQLNDFGKYAQCEGIKVVGTPILFPSKNVLKYKAMLKIGTKMPFKSTLNLRQELLQQAQILIANSNPERQYLHEAYGVPLSGITTIGTGVDNSYLAYEFDEKHLPAATREIDDFVLMAGRVTPLKNQLKVAQLFAGTNYNLIITGAPDNSYPAYVAALRKVVTAHPNMHWIEGLPAGSDALKALFAKAICHVLWSDTEVAALVNLEAAALGCPVLSRNHITTVDIFKHHAFYAASEKELMQQITNIAQFAKSERIDKTSTAKTFVAQHYTWEMVVEKTFEIYRQLLQT